jgi:hypothetical protein
VEPVALADTEKTFPELFARIQKTIEVLEKVKVSFRVFFFFNGRV